MRWKLPMREILISRLNGKVELTPTDMDHTVHHSMSPSTDAEVIIVYYGALTSLIVDGNVCIRGNRLIVEVDVVNGNRKCIVVHVADTSGEE
jgi:hypothetical protein